jgi:hypothetical protein
MTLVSTKGLQDHVRVCRREVQTPHGFCSLSSAPPLRRRLVPKLGRRWLSPVPASRVWLLRIAALIILWRPLLVVIALSIAIRGRTAIARGAAAENQGDKQNTQNSHQFLHFENSRH